MTSGPRLVLASGSPQRRAILETLGVGFVTCVSGVEELATGDPSAVALENALRKARAVADRLAAGAVALPDHLAAGAVALPDHLAAGAVALPDRPPGASESAPEAAGRLPVLGVDTLVALDSTIYGKPADEQSARATLRALSGRAHTVVSGLALIAGDLPARSATVLTSVRIRRLDRATIDWYVAAGEWRGRAGGYAIQGRGIALVAGIDGDYSNVVGLPVGGLLGLWPGLLVS